jgi:hypothetical protein
MSQLPSLSKELDKYICVRVVPGEVTDKKAYKCVATLIEEKEYMNTPTPDLWDFHIVPMLKKLARVLNEIDAGCVRYLPLPPEKTPSVAGAFISADGKIPLRFVIMYMPADNVSAVGRYILTIDTMFQEVA